ncbi:MAG TPA: hypothetical protein DCE80_10580 [Ignavibacteriales bacterium]|nr:hypothetical protein [Ignavibacteriales bacterium]
MQIINKNTNLKINIDFQPTIENLIAYNYYPDYIEVPIELYDKDVEVIEGEILEKPVDLEKLKQQKILEVENGYTNSFLNGLESSIGIKLHIKPEDQLNYIGAMIATASLQDFDILPFPMIDFDGVVHQITKGQATTAYLEIVGYKAQMESKRAALLGQIKVGTIDNIEEIVWQQ